MPEILVVESDLYGRKRVLSRFATTARCDVCGARMGEDPTRNQSSVRCSMHRMQLSIVWSDEQELHKQPVIG